MISSLLTEKLEGEVAHSPIPPCPLALCGMVCKLSDREAEATGVGKIGALQGVNSALLPHGHSCHRQLLHQAPAADSRSACCLPEQCSVGLYPNSVGKHLAT